MAFCNALKMTDAPPTHSFYYDWRNNIYQVKEGFFYNFYNKWEESTSRKREEFYYIIAFLSTLYLAFGHYNFFYCNFFVGFLYPAYLTLYYLQSNEVRVFLRNL